MQISTAHPVNHIVSNNALYQAPIIQQNYHQPQVQRNSFFLKWIAGTTISKCYGCRKKYNILLNSQLMTWLWHIKIFANLEILLLRYCDILMHLKMSISIHNKFVSEPDTPTSITLGYNPTSNAAVSFAIALSEISIRVLLSPMKSISAIFGTSFKIRIFLFVIFPRPFLL